LSDYREAWALQRSIAEQVTAGTRPDTVVFCEHPPTVTLGRRTDPDELHVPTGADVEVVETDRGGRSTYHAPGQLVCYPILDLNRHGRDVRRYCRLLEQAIVETLARFDDAAGQRPVVFERFAGALDEKDAIAIQNQSAYAEDGVGRVASANTGGHPSPPA